jgi:cell division protein FtsB
MSKKLINTEELLHMIGDRVESLERDLTDAVRSEISLSETINKLHAENKDLRAELNDLKNHAIKPVHKVCI